jgi:hypothetical protein
MGETKEIYSEITRYNYSREVVGKLFNQFLSSPHGLNDAVTLSRIGENWPLLLEIANNQISDDEVVESFCFPKIFIKESSYKKYLDISSEMKKDLVVCEVKTLDKKSDEYLKLGYDTGDIFLNNLRDSAKGHPLKIVTDKQENKKMAELCGEDYMGVQILCSFIKNWMWICFGGSSNIFPFFPVKILSLCDQTLCIDLIRKISIRRFGKIGEILPEFETLIYCLPGEKDGPSRTDGHRPLPNLQKLIKDFSEQKMDFDILF